MLISVELNSVSVSYTVSIKYTLLQSNDNWIHVTPYLMALPCLSPQHTTCFIQLLSGDNNNCLLISSFTSVHDDDEVLLCNSVTTSISVSHKI